MIFCELMILFWIVTIQVVSRWRLWRTLCQRQQTCSRRWTRCSSGPSTRRTLSLSVAHRTFSAGCSCRGTSLWGEANWARPSSCGGAWCSRCTSERSRRSTCDSKLLLLHSERPPPHTHQWGKHIPGRGSFAKSSFLSKMPRSFSAEYNFLNILFPSPLILFSHSHLFIIPLHALSFPSHHFI